MIPRKQTIGERAFDIALNQAEQAYQKMGDARTWIKTVCRVYEEAIRELAEKEEANEKRKIEEECVRDTDLFETR